MRLLRHRKQLHRVLLFVALCTLIVGGYSAAQEVNPADIAALKAQYEAESFRRPPIPTDQWAVVLEPGADPSAVAQQLGFRNAGGIADLPNTYLFEMGGSREGAAAQRAANALYTSSSVVWFEQQFARQYERYQDDGTPLAPAGNGGSLPGTTARERQVVSGGLNTFVAYELNGDVLVAGEGLRGTGSGSILVRGLPNGATIHAAFLYWATIGNSNTFTTVNFAGSPVTGVVIGTASDSCWGASANFAYWANVTSRVTGNGTYTISGLPSSLAGGNDSQGASLVIVYTHPSMARRSIRINDGAVVLTANGDTYSNSFTGITTDGTPVTNAKISLVVGDGQSGSGLNEGQQFLNGTAFATNPFTGREGNYWDSLTWDVTGIYPASSTVTTQLQTSDSSGNVDCLLWVANILSVTTTGFTPPILPISDPLRRHQWHLNNFGQTGGTVGMDARVLPVWNAGIRGSGVTVAVVDDGLQWTHPDLSPNYVASASYDFNGNDSDPSPGSSIDSHGTSVGGVIAARDNGVCGVGAAYRAGVSGIRLLGAATTDAQDANALTYQFNTNWIYNNSWGPNAPLDGPGPLLAAAMSNAVVNGRSGRGTIYVFSAGNGLQNNENVNENGFANSRFTIAVSAVDHNGRQTWYSEPGTAIFVTAGSNFMYNWWNYNTLPPGTTGITTTDLLGSAGYNGYSATLDCTNDFGGTSSSGPLVSGVIALMLNANPNLGWRDVQHILARTAFQNDPTDPEWRTNAAGFRYNFKYGFGAVDAQAAVALAQTWTNVPAPTNYSGSQTVDATIPDAGAPITRSINLSVPSNFVIEHVEVVFNATHTYRGDLELLLTAPSGTQSLIKPTRIQDSGDNFNNWRMMTINNWGENGSGTWTLSVRDAFTGDVGTWNSWQIVLHGYLRTVPPPLNIADRIGIYNPATAVWMLRNSLTTGDPNIIALYGGIAGGLPVTGDWNNDGVDTLGMYVPNLAYWFLRNSNTTGTGEIFFVYGGIPGALPVVGDWNGDGIDTPGLYVPSTGQWLLRNSNTTGTADISFVFGGIPGALPIAGDWNGDGIDTIGLYNPATAQWLLRNSNTTGVVDVSLLYGGIAGGQPVVGDWDGDGDDTVGMYVPNLAYWFLRNSNTTGIGEIFLVYGGIAGAPGITGHWTGTVALSPGADAVVPETPAPLTTVIESDSERVSASEGWRPIPAPEASGGQYLQSDDPNAALTLPFSGGSVAVVYTAAPELGAFDIEVDGVIVQTVDAHADEMQFRQQVAVSGLGAGEHVLRIVNLIGAAAIDAFVVEGAPLGGSAAGADDSAAVVTPEPTAEPAGAALIVEGMVTVESDDPAVMRSADWQPMNRPPGASGGQYLINTAADQTLSLTFSGTRVEVVYVNGPSFGDFIVQIDDVQYPAVSTGLVEYAFGSRFAIEGLAEGAHTLVLLSSGVVGIDAFLVQTLGIPVEDPAPVTAEPVITIEPTVEPTVEPTQPALMPPIYLDLNAGAEDWTASAGWQWTSDAAFGGVGAGLALTSGELAEENAQWLLPVDLRLATQPVKLMFHSWYQGVGSALVQVSIDGVNWLPVSAVPVSGEWLVLEADLSAFSGQIIQFRFTWQAGPTTGSIAPPDRWLVDDVLIAFVEAVTPTDVPTLLPTEQPTLSPTDVPTLPAVEPTLTEEPVEAPSAEPTAAPTETPASDAGQSNG